MKKIRNITKLNYLELHVLFQHIKLGIPHLKKYLNEAQFGELLRYSELTDEQSEDLPCDSIEKSGSFLLVLNTLFTCTIGTWLGMAGFMGFGIGSKAILPIIIFTAILSSYLGYFSYKNTEQKAKASVTEQRLANLRLKLIQTMNAKRESEIDRTIGNLNKIMRESGGENKKFIFKSQEEIISWVNKFYSLHERKATVFSQPVIHDIYINDLSVNKQQLMSWLSRNMAVSKKHELKEVKSGGSFFLEILTDPTINIPKKITPQKSWLRTNLMSLLVGLLPTVLGGFGSLFVYFDGIPKIVSEIGWGHLLIISNNNFVKSFEIGVAILITCYFGYTFALNNFRTFKREQELKQTDKKIMNEESHTIEINARLNVLRKIKQRITTVIESYKKLEAIMQSIKDNEVKLKYKI